jgi:hypothetical protein
MGAMGWHQLSAKFIVFKQSETTRIHEPGCEILVALMES